ncbi:hypothetical protein L3X38_024874 [Prunus dulcis]|uniref:Uncharacterized protein n=1 Tax=Prunus dulcis TaxID=3755 RepID=A0AAD4W355_PRUDU|nr:hypothetical protein L3X38_024874 [Prunus dulcis]
MSHIIILKCSKQGSRRAKKQHTAGLAATILRIRQRSAIRISDGVLDSSATMLPISEGVSNPTTEGINVSSKGKGKLGEFETKEENRKPRRRPQLQYLSKGKKLLVEVNPRG